MERRSSTNNWFQTHQEVTHCCCYCPGFAVKGAEHLVPYKLNSYIMHYISRGYHRMTTVFCLYIHSTRLRPYIKDWRRQAADRRFIEVKISPTIFPRILFNHEIMIKTVNRGNRDTDREIDLTEPHNQSFIDLMRAFIELIEEPKTKVVETIFNFSTFHWETNRTKKERVMKWGWSNDSELRLSI